MNRMTRKNHIDCFLNNHDSLEEQEDFIDQIPSHSSLSNLSNPFNSFFRNQECIERRRLEASDTLPDCLLAILISERFLSG